MLSDSFVSEYISIQIKQRICLKQTECYNIPVVFVMATGYSLRIMKNMCQFILFLREPIGDSENANKGTKKSQRYEWGGVNVRKRKRIFEEIFRKARERLMEMSRGKRVLDMMLRRHLVSLIYCMNEKRGLTNTLTFQHHLRFGP